MTTSSPVARLYPDWPQYASRIAGAVRDLSPAQLAIRAAPTHDPLWVLAAHVASARVYWLCGILGEPGADRAAFVADPARPWGWEDDEDHPRTGRELEEGLAVSFDIVADCLHRWTVDDLDVAFDRTLHGVTVAHTRASVLNRLVSHDAFHAGEVSQLLGTSGLPEIDLWRRARPTD